MGEVRGTCDERFLRVRKVLEENLDSGADIGASVAVCLDGAFVVDLWGGSVDEERATSWEADTIVNAWSITKTMMFLCALLLADRGELDFHAPVRHYWPEFGAADKKDIEVRHLMAHMSGLAGWDEPLEPEDLADWEKCTTLLAAQAPWWPPGTTSGYHVLSQGYLVGEVIRRITGTTLGTFFKSEIAEPLGADFHIGLPESEDARVSPVFPPPSMDLSFLDQTLVVTRALTNPPLDGSYPNQTWWRRAEIPAANGHGNARSIAAVQSIVAQRGESGGTRLLSEAGTDVIFEEQIRGMDLVLFEEQRFGMGYGLLSSKLEIPPRGCYWGGYGGSVIVMDQDLRLTVAYVMNRMEEALVADARGSSIVKAAFEAARNYS